MRTSFSMYLFHAVKIANLKRDGLPAPDPFMDVLDSLLSKEGVLLPNIYYINSVGTFRRTVTRSIQLIRTHLTRN